MLCVDLQHSGQVPEGFSVEAVGITVGRDGGAYALSSEGRQVTAGVVPASFVRARTIQFTLRCRACRFPDIRRGSTPLCARVFSVRGATTPSHNRYSLTVALKLSLTETMPGRGPWVESNMSFYCCPFKRTSTAPSVHVCFTAYSFSFAA
ncbi:hypothetical protein EDB87DRAFT_1302307 [Lactarius vividus]|nr:hypothetical protein EDB87DRAFT_1302307 [Lactarius vividus]